MGHRVLGLTWDERTVHVAVVETRLRRFELKGVFQVPRLRGDEAVWVGAEEQASGGTAPYEVGGSVVPVVEALNSVLPRPVDQFDSIAVAYPGDRGFVRRLTFPFKESDKIAATLPMQMAGQVLGPDEVHCAFERVASGAGGTEVLAVAVRRGELAEWLAELGAEGLHPSHVSMDGVCMLALLPYLQAEGEGARMLLWAQGNTLDVGVVDGMRPVLVRSVVLGEPVLNHNEPSPGLLREVVLSAAAASEAGVHVGSAWVGGFGSEVLAGPVGEALDCPCMPMNPTGIPGAAEGVVISPASAKAVALAVAGASGRGPGSLNLRTGDFSLEGTRGLLRERSRYFAAVLGLVAALLVGNAVVKYLGLKADRDAVVADLRAFSAELLGKEREDFDGVLKQVKSLTEEDVRIFPRWTAVDTLNRIIGAVMAMGRVEGSGGDQEGGAPETGGERAYKAELESVRIEPRTASLRGEADSIETLDALVARLKTDPCFQDVVTESTERIQFERHQGWQRFSIRMNIDCTPKEAQKKPQKPAVEGRAQKG